MDYATLSKTFIDLGFSVALITFILWSSDKREQYTREREKAQDAKLEKLVTDMATAITRLQEEAVKGNELSRQMLVYLNSRRTTPNGEGL